MREFRSRIGESIYFACIMLVSVSVCGCSHFSEGYDARPAFKEANDLFNNGDFNGSLKKYQQIGGKYPTTADRVLFEMGIVYAYPKNEHKDYQKSLECFRKLVTQYPHSEYRQNSEAMIFNVSNVAMKDHTITAQRTEIETLRHQLKDKENDMVALQKKIEALEQKFIAFAIRNASVDRILIDKKARRLMVMAKGDLVKSYRIALGGNPVGPKQCEGDNKTPEGTYIIDSRNGESRYHRALHISYPNQKDRERAKKLGVSPGGDIMIHGIKNGFSWVGDAHAEVDWTQGCIAVTDEEIEEIARLAPDGTVVEIRP